jgi:hypothetical protein
MINYEMPTIQEPGLPADPAPATTTVDPMDASKLVAVFDRWAPEIDRMANKVQGLVVKDAETSAMAAEMAAQARKLVNIIDKKRREVVAPYHQVKSTVDLHCRKVSQHLLQIQREAEHRNTAYLQAIEKKRLEAEREAREAERLRQMEAEKARKESEAKNEPPPPPPVHTPIIPPAETTKVKTESGTTKLEYKEVPTIVDFKALPEKCFEARASQVTAAVMPWINAQIKAGFTDIPGVHIDRVPVVKTRVR